MPSLSKFIRIENNSAEPTIVGDTRVTPQSQALVIQFPFGGIVWNRPTAVLVERDDSTQRIPITDVTRVAQIVLFGLILSISVIITVFAQRHKERSS